MLTATQAAARLQISRSTLYGLVKRGAMPCYRVDGALWFKPEWLAEFGAGQRRRGAPTLDPEQLQGATYAVDLERLGCVEAVASKYRISHQAVSEAIARYNIARRS